MTLKQYLVAMGISTVFSWFAVGLIITLVDPAAAQPVVFAIFYVSLFFGLTGLISVGNLALRLWLRRRDELAWQLVLASFRQAVMLAALLVAALMLQNRQLLNWLNAALLVAALTLLEFFFVSLRPRR